jgi:uncharacterized protein with beta-barrel porin domain
MRFLLASTGLGALAFMTTTSAGAETTISTATTAPATTSSAGDIHVTSTGSIKPTGGLTTVVTINSNNKVANEGTLAIQGVNGATGILANPGFSGDITNSGPITIDEDYTPTDTDKDGDLDGPFALGSGRYGIRIAPGGTYTGNIANSGTITIEGNGSAGIAIDSALNGSFNGNGGTISVTGNDSVGIRTSDVSGNVNIGNASSVTVAGQNSVGVLLGGNIGGAVTIQGNVTATGYRYTTAPSDPSKLDVDDLLQGGPAVLIAGNVAGGILLDTRPADNDPNKTDEDNDGIPDASETTASIVTFGAAPALKIGSTTQDIAIGAVASSSAGHGLVIKGSVTGTGVYSGVSATGVEIGGTGHLVNVAGGMTVTGAITATANGASATAIHLGNGAGVPQMVLSGNVTATGGGNSTSAAQAILIDNGATVNSITNSGNILATRSGSSGTAAAIVDKSGSLGLVQNGGSISVANAGTLGDSATAIDLSANATGAIVRQVAAASGKPAPSISGRILFGAGNDTLDIQAGSVIGKLDFGGGSDTLNLSGNALFRGSLVNSEGLALNVGSGSTFDIQSVGTVDLGSLTAAAGASLGVRIGESSHTLYNVAGTASFAAGSKILVTFDKIANATGNFTIVDAGMLVGAQNLTNSVVALPFLFTSSLISNATTGQVSLGVQLKSASELGLNQSETSIIGAVLGAADADQGVAGTLLNIADGQTLKATLQQMMPEHAGGVFETVTKPSRLAAGILGQPGMVHGLWLQQLAWGSSKSVGDTSSYKLSSWGAVGGYDVGVGPMGSVGLSLGYYFGKDSHEANELASNHYEAGIYWRGGVGPLRAWARGTAATIDFDSTRTFSGLIGTSVITRSADAKWKGRLYSASAGLSYERHVGRLSLRPNASIEYYKLNEKGYTETGGGAAYDLTVRSRKSDEAAADAMLAFGYDLVRRDDEDSGWMRVEIEGGRREILSGSIGDTVASFGSGTPFTLSAEGRRGGWRGGLRALGGGSSVTFVAEANAEQQRGSTSIGGRLGLNIGF